MTFRQESSKLKYDHQVTPEVFDGVMAEFEVPEVSLGKVSVGVAISPEDQIGRLQVMTERYLAEGYLVQQENESNVEIPTIELPISLALEHIVSLDDGLERLYSILDEHQRLQFSEHGILISRDCIRYFVDKYHWQSIPIVAKTQLQDGSVEYLASARIVLAAYSDGHDLPIHEDSSISLYDEMQLRELGLFDDVNTSVAELSQYAKGSSMKYRIAKDGQTALLLKFSQLGILRCSVLMSKRLGIESWLATIDDRVVKLLNGSAMAFGLPQIGEPVFYMGSTSNPVYIPIDSSLDNATNGPQSNDTSRSTAAIIRGDLEAGIDNLQWYNGK